MSLDNKKKVIRLGDSKNQTEIIDEEIVEKENTNQKDNFLSLVSLATNLGFSLSLPIVIGAFIGVYLDKTLGIQPKMTLSLIFTGVLISFSYIYKFLKENKK
jgi:F0F1-type ATP synthase assembly protein I